MKSKFIILFLVVFLFLIINFASANIYYTDIYFTIPDSVYIINESVIFKGYVYQSNYTNNGTIVLNSSALSNVLVNLTIRNSNGNYTSNYTFTTDSSGAFYSRSNYFTNSSVPQVIAPSTAGSYYLRAQYIDSNNNLSFSEIEISVINKTLDLLRVSSEKAIYNPSENVKVNVEAIRLIGDRIIYVSNVSVNGSLRNLTKDSLQTFSCTTGSNGKCTASVTAPSYGNYILEIGDFKAFSSFSVVPFSYNIYMKDDLGKSFKNIFASGEQAKIEVKINNASDSDIYTFSGYIADSAGNSVKSITSTTLNFNNSFTNTFLFTIDTSFSYSTYSAHVTVTKTSDGSISSLMSFQIQDWMLSVNKKEISSGFEYEFSTFPNQTIRLEALPTYRSNGSVIASINSSSFSINLKDSLNNIFSSANASWNSSCGKSGCYEFFLTSPLNTGQYILYTTLSNSGDSQTDSKIINIINGVMSAQSTDKDGNIKELFGTNEYAYLSLSAYNLSSSLFNLTDAEIFIISYMNGSEFSYTNVSNFDLVSMSNNNSEWAWNSSLQRIKLDVPKSGGLYNVFIFGNNRTLGAIAKFIVNPYDVCSVAKDTAGTANYYAWQFKTSDTVYFEIKINQANNPLGRATALNSSTNSSGNVSYGKGAQCTIDTTTKQVINNATISITEVVNLESGALQNINTTDSTCQASDNQGAYTCTVKPRSKWDGGQNIIKFNIQGQDGTSSVFYSRFEARAFYLYGWSNVWQNNPSSNITLNLYMYEAGSGWWSGYGSSGISGSVTVKRVEYQGRDGEWLWPPVDSGYNVSALNSSSINGSMGTISMPVSYTQGGIWKTGYYRVVLQATTSSGDTDYGYAWFGVKLWDVYGQPIECSSTSCNYKSYFNSRENISLYITINKAGNNWWSSNYGGGDIYGNVSVGIKKIQDCKRWPCKDLNSSEYSANTINVNSSSSGYWYSGVNLSSANRYIININKTSGRWNTGWYSVILDVNGTDTGYAWFNTIAFYVETQPTDINGSNYKYSIRGNQPMFFNVTTTKSYKWQSGSVRYNISDYLNTTVDDAVLRTWDQVTYQSKEYNYPEDINITPLSVNGNGLINITFLNRTTNTTTTWPTGYYWGELTLKNSENETSTGWLWFNVQPFRVQINTVNYQYDFDSDQCVNASIYIYDPDWYSSNVLAGNYSITNVYENIWSGYSPQRTTYTNYTNSSFNGSANIQICPNNNAWGSGSWGGYHYLNIVVANNQSESQNGWLYFRTVPFRVQWGGGIGNVRTNANINTTVNLTKPSTGAATSGNLTKLYQWRYDNYQSKREEYNFSVGNGSNICYSNVSGQCTVNGTQTVNVYPPSGGWRVGWNYIQAEWTAQNNAASKVDDWSGISFEGREGYNGWFDTWWYDGSNYYWKYYIAVNENITIKLNVRNANYNSVNVNITNVEYAYSGENCWSDWCRSYITAVYSPTNTSNGGVVLNIREANGNNWTKGHYAIRATVSGSEGTAVITGGNVRVKDFTAPNLTISLPINNATYNSSLLFSATTSETSQCYVYIVNYDNFYNWYCWNWNATSNSSNSSSAQIEGACNYTKYNYNGSSYYYEYVYNNWHSIGNNSAYVSCSSYGSSCYTWGSPDSSWQTRASTFLTTGGRTHTYTFNVANLTNQAYGMQVWCNDDDWNSVSALKAFRINNTG